MIDLLEHRTTATQMTLLDDDIGAVQRRELIDELKGLQQRAASFAERFGLNRHRRDVRRTLIAEISEVWTTVENIRLHRMKGMGEITGETADVLQREVESLLAQVSRLHGRLGS